MRSTCKASESHNSRDTMLLSAPDFAKKPLNYYWRFNQTLHMSSVTPLLFNREGLAGGNVCGPYGRPHGMDNILYGHQAFIQRLQCDNVLEGHLGCVNHLCWNQTGTLLASGSDDANVIVWNYQTKKRLEVIQTKHRLNVFAVCFVPGTNDHVIASGAMDCDVRIHYAPFAQNLTQKFQLHSGRVKDIASSPHVPHVFWSVAEDGLVYQFDVRALPTDDGDNRKNSSSGALINLGKGKHGNSLRGMAMAVHPLDANKVVVACGDSYARLYDRRMLRLQRYGRTRKEAMRSASTAPVEIFSPPHAHMEDYNMIESRRALSSHHGTSIQFNSTGSEILASYHNDHIYLYNVNGNSQPTTLFTRSNGDYQATGSTKGWENGMYMDCWRGPISPSLEQVELLLKEGLEQCKEERFSEAIESFASALGSNLASQESLTRKRLHYGLAQAYMNRNWNADMYLASAHCKCALQLDPNDLEVEQTYIRALWASGRRCQCTLAAHKYAKKYPEHATDVADLLEMGDTLQDTNNTSTRRRSSSSSSSNNSITFAYPIRGRRESTSENESSSNDQVGAENERRNDTSPRPIFYHLAPANDSTFSVPTLLPHTDDEFWTGSCVNDLEVNCDVQRRYIGCANTQTDIKEATFFGPNDAFVVAGSDDGYAYIWQKATGKLITAIKADADIVNCVRSHPTETCLATSGIENVVRLWTPTSAENTCPSKAELQELTKKNQIMIHREWRTQTVIQDPASFLQAMFASEDNEGVSECATS